MVPGHPEALVCLQAFFAGTPFIWLLFIYDYILSAWIVKLLMSYAAFIGRKPLFLFVISVEQ